ncbi:CHASE2 domain-containing protein [Komagataeibacter sp. FXV3]|uniref:CHASE2 domain-containing protein n=1 Tax=Komagataeibacter sp. FXV3 TaxID=2608998 RepID=UPI00187B9598|nr:CHASE2 domain-containing protein [Komagataeibacter sp. FXV3]
MNSIIYLLVMLLFWGVFKFIDPMGLESATKQSSATMFNAISAPFYGMSSDATHRNVAVVAITDHTLDAYDTSFPFEYKRHIDTLNRILDAHPAAIFVDLRMMYERPGESLDEFRPVIQRAKDMGVPLLFGRGDDGNDQPDLPEPLIHSEGYTAGIRAEGGAYPLIHEPEEEGGKKAKHEPETHEEGPPISGNAAYDLYSRLCQDGWGGRCPGFRPQDFRSPMIIQWGLKPDPAQHMVSQLDDYWQVRCQTQQFLGCGRLGMAMSLGFHYTFRYRTPGKYVFAFYPLEIGAEQLGQRGLGTPEGSPALGSLLQGRAVFYGTDLRDQHDDTYIPMLGRVPGVIVHAMAFDNLVVYGKRYFHEPGEFICLDWAEIAELVLWMGFALYMVVRRQWPLYDRQKLRSWPGLRLCIYHGQRLLAHARRYLAHVHQKSFPVVDSIVTFRWYWTRFFVLFSVAICLWLIDLVQRGTTHGLGNLVGAYFLLAMLFMVTWACPIVISMKKPAQPTQGKPEEKRESSYLANLILLATLAAIGFVLNGDGPRWPNADWIGLLLLRLATQEAAEPGGFVAWFSNVVGGGGRLLSDWGRGWMNRVLTIFHKREI